MVLRGVNDDEVVQLATWALSQGSEMRFLEAMPIGPAGRTNRLAFVAAAEIRRKLAEHFALTPLAHHQGETAVRYRAEGKECSGVVGLIAPVSEPFCGECRRMRITADGKLYPCLLDSRNVDLSPAFNGAFSRDRAAQIIESAVAQKQPQGQFQSTTMVKLGG